MSVVTILSRIRPPLIVSTTIYKYTTSQYLPHGSGAEIAFGGLPPILL